MSFVNNSGGLWDFIELERDWENIGTNLLSSGLLEETTEADAIGSALMPTEQFEIEKMLLKRDFEIINHCMSFDEQGRVLVRENPLTLI
jgi:hypothetical protein